MSVFQRILVPIDGSAPSEAAVALALRMAKDWSSELVFASIVDSDRIVAECASTAYGDPLPIVEAMTESAGQLLGAAAQQARDAGVASRTALERQGSAVPGILEAAKRERADLIVMGSHGRRGLSRLVMGSTTEGVLRASELPVLVVREPHEEKRRPARTAQTATHL